MNTGAKNAQLPNFPMLLEYRQSTFQALKCCGFVEDNNNEPKLFTENKHAYAL